eukprot:CAMPEP_0183347970 /NCGR_PEP_ID=MMETSP0164_2-20130417/12634_1 /TAXON_ID=221442 /ORGANISM="Coccolithus pelagicus ssp braarudi, Strain PLY182g" /LENGTH=219 /DNA_ID=CAMNT_0025519493 /DNA_START=182 /DNA_END=837 /DNA_ORIENTATION=-
MEVEVASDGQERLAFRLHLSAWAREQPVDECLGVSARITPVELVRERRVVKAAVKRQCRHVGDEHRNAAGDDRLSELRSELVVAAKDEAERGVGQVLTVVRRGRDASIELPHTPPKVTCVCRQLDALFARVAAGGAAWQRVILRQVRENSVLGVRCEERHVRVATKRRPHVKAKQRHWWLHVYLAQAAHIRQEIAAAPRRIRVGLRRLIAHSEARRRPG